MQISHKKFEFFKISHFNYLSEPVHNTDFKEIQWKRKKQFDNDLHGDVFWIH